PQPSRGLRSYCRRRTQSASRRRQPVTMGPARPGTSRTQLAGGLDLATSDQARNYLHFDGPPDIRLLSAHRVHELARRLYQLQSFPWFDRVVANIRTRDLSGAGFELDVLY